VPRERRIACVCGHCRALQWFLNDNTQATRPFTENVSVRKHLESSLGALGRTPELRIETDKGRPGSAHTLVVHKIGIEYTQKKAIWEGEIVKMRKEGGAFRSPFMSKLFGGVVAQIVGLEKRPVTAGVTLGTVGEGDANSATHITPRLLQPVTASAQKVGAPLVLAGTKSKAGVIDLTEDDSI
jgi:hypothetical protein